MITCIYCGSICTIEDTAGNFFIAQCCNCKSVFKIHLSAFDKKEILN